MSLIAEIFDTEYGRMVLPVNDINQTGALRDTKRGVHHDRMTLLAGILDALPGSDRVVVDAGANVGAFTLPLAAHVGPLGRVHAFEPQPMIHACLAGSAVLSQLWNRIRTYNVCLSSAAGVIEVPQYDYAQRLNFGSIEFGPHQHELLDQPRGTNPDAIEFVDVHPLDSYAFPQVDLIKIDVQRMEVEVLAGAAETLQRCRPVLFVEWVGNDTDQLRMAIASHGYSIRNEFGDDWLCYPNSP